MNNRLSTLMTLLMLAITMQAQEVKKGYETVEVAYSPTFMLEDGKTYYMHGINAEVHYNIPLSKQTPVNLQAGLGFKYNNYRKSTNMDWNYFVAHTPNYQQYPEKPNLNLGKVEDKIDLIAFYIPVNVTYDIKLPNSNVVITPYAGLRFSFNFTTSMSSSNKLTAYSQRKGYPIPEYQRLNIMTAEADAWKLFNIGWQAGVNARLTRRFYTGIGYTMDFMNISTNTRIISAAVKCGVVLGK